jgi:DNA-binding MarR family transcriptional regulator
VTEQNGTNETNAFQDVLQLSATWSAVSRVLERALLGSGMSLDQTLALLAIETAPQPLLLSKLAARLVQEPQSITSMVDRLARHGWARRVYHGVPGDRRAVPIELTEAGRAKVAELRALLSGAAEEVTASLDVTQKAGLRDGIVALYEVCRGQHGVRLPEFA